MTDLDDLRQADLLSRLGIRISEHYDVLHEHAERDLQSEEGRSNRSTPDEESVRRDDVVGAEFSD